MNEPARRNHVGLRALDPETDLPLLERWLQSPQVARWWKVEEPNGAGIAERSRDADAVITVDGRPVGYLCWQIPTPSELKAAGLTDLPDGLVDIDIMIGEPAYLGCGVGPEALHLLLARLHDDGARFAGLGTSTANHRAIRAFEKTGFRPFKDFEDREYGPCRYMVARLGANDEGVIPADRGARRS